MRFRAEDRPTLTTTIILTVFALGLTARLITNLVVPSEPVSLGDQGKKGDTESGVRRSASSIRTFDPSLRSDRLRFSESVRYEETARNIFRIEAPSLKIFLGRDPTSPPPVPSSKSSLPTMGLRFFGFANIPGQSKRIFLSNGSDVFIGREGEIVNRRYRVLQITPSSVELEDLISGIRQTLSLAKDETSTTTAVDVIRPLHSNFELFRFSPQPGF